MKKITLILVTLSFTACMAKKAGPGTSTNTNVSTSSLTQTPADSEVPGDPTTIAVLPTTLGNRNFDQINGTMETVTGVRGNTNVINRFKALRLQLPSDNDIKSFSFSGQGAITVLAAEYCTALTTNATYASQFAAATGSFNLNQLPAAAFAGTAPATLAQNLIIRFWGSGYAAYPNASAAQASVVKLIADLVAGQTSNTTTTRNAVIGACTSVLASAPVSTY